MRIIKLLFVLYLYCNSASLYAQNAKTDSLEKLLQKRSLHDSTKLRLLKDLTLNLSKTGSPKTLFYANQLIQKAKKQDHKLTHGNALYNIAIYYEKVNLFDSSLFMLKEALRITKGSDKKLNANVEEAMGMNYFKKSYTDSSLICFEKALKMQSTLNDSSHILNILSNLGILYSIKGDNNKGQEYFLKCLKIHEAKGDSIALTRSYINLGLVMLKANLLKKAHFYLQRAVSIALITKDSSNIINGYRNIGITYEEEKKYDSAISENLKALKYVNEKNISQRASIQHALSSCYLMKNDNLKALEYLLPALKVKEMLGQQRAVSGLLINLASIKLDMGAFDEAIAAAIKADRLADETEALETKMKGAEILLGCYIKTGNTKKAFDMYNKVFLLKDSIYNMNLSSSVADIQVKYETEKKEQENKSLQQQNELKESKIKAKNLLIIILIAGLVLITILIFWQVSLFRIKKQKQVLAEQQKLQHERERISRDLHDNVGGQLSYVLYSLDGINNESKEKRVEAIQNVNESVRNVIGNLRETIWAINDEAISANDFSDKLKVYIRSMFKNTDTKVLFTETIRSNIQLNSLTGLNLYRICQEIINNAFKHSKAKEIKINIETEDTISIEISDNGIGFDIEKNNSETFGLINIRSRANEVGIKLDLKTKPNEGVKYKLVV